ncbi:MAG TPA: 4a-hydroxytetrahydrobiopterin dehydratase [Bacteroidota bacterium]|nr:4a-hydroxytetrahydrobiopterin dehydratase [Bacteroidota bacterium]
MSILTKDKLAGHLKTLKGWELRKDEIVKTFDCKDFVHSMGFVQSVGLLAEKADHHPDIDIRWNKVTLTLATHSEGGITMKDITLAKEIESL